MCQNTILRQKQQQQQQQNNSNNKKIWITKPDLLFVHLQKCFRFVLTEHGMVFSPKQFALVEMSRSTAQCLTHLQSALQRWQQAS